MRRISLFLIPAVAMAVGAGLMGWQRGLLFSQSPASTAQAGALLDSSVVSFRVQFGVTDQQPRAWDGSLSASGGEIVNVRSWRPKPEDRVEKGSFSLATRQGVNFKRRSWEPEPPTAPVPYMVIPGIVVDVKTAGGAKVSFKTKNGAFALNTADLAAGRPVKFLNGSVVADRVPTTHLLTEQDYENDYSSVLAGANGELWAAWAAYRGGKNQVLARRYDGKVWGPAVKVSENPGDVFLVKMGRDGKGNPWVVWSDQVSGNFDLYARSFDGGSWSAVTRLTDDAQPDVYHNVATDSNGILWVTWQGVREGKSQIFARRYDGSSWSAPERISTSPANDWEPAIAADRAGRVYIAWDTYDKGNYDVMMSRYESGKWSPPAAIADSLKFEAHVSLACDNQNRLWAAWNESGIQWGKDTGFLVKKEGTLLYQWRAVAVAVHDGTGWNVPAADFEASLPRELREYNDFPVLQSDGAGRVWLFFRHRFGRIADVPYYAALHRAAWEIYASTFEGDRWTTPVPVPASGSRMDVRAGYSSDGRGNVYAAWPTDGRDYDSFLYRHSDVYAARMPGLQTAAAAPQLKPRVQPELASTPIHPREKQDLARIRGYAIRSGDKTYRIYRGDVHRHTEFSHDGNNDGSLAQTYRYAMDAAELDFLMVSEHNSSGGPDVEYVDFLLQQMADVMMVQRRFTPLYGYERSLGYPNGHRNVIFAKRGIPTLPITPAEQKGQEGAKALYEYLKRNNGIAISHTSATGMGTDWRDNDPEVEPLVEIYQGDRVSAEYEGAPKAANSGNPASQAGGFRPAGYVWNAWAKGYKLGVQASSDHLSSHLSYACTLATDFTREGLLDAMKKRHSYGATDNIILDYRMESGGKEYIQGDIAKVGSDYKLLVKVIGTSPVRQIDIIRNNQFLHTRQPMEQDVNFTFIDNQPPAGESYYYVRVIQVDEQMAWSSPIWVQR